MMPQLLDLLVATIGGGLFVKTAEWGMVAVGILTNEKREFRSDLYQQVQTLQADLENLRDKYREERWARTSVEARLMRLLDKHNQLREKNGMDRLKYEELERIVIDPFGNGYE